MAHDGPQVEPGQGIEQQELQVDADGGMLGEEHQEEYDAEGARDDHQRDVPEQKDAAGAPLHRKEDDGDTGQYYTALKGRERKPVLHRLHTRRNDDAALLDQWAVLPVVTDPGVVEVVHQVVGQKLLLASRRLHIGLDAQQQVVAESGPRMALRHLVYGAPVTVCNILAASIFYLSVDASLDDVPCLCRAVVVEVVVAIHSVLWKQVDAERIVHLLLLVAGQVEHLFGDHAAIVPVLLLEDAEGEASQLVVGKPEDEARHKMRGLEVEDAPVEGDVGLLVVQVVPAQCRVAIEAVYLVVRLAGEQAYFYGVKIFGGERLVGPGGTCQKGCRQA